MDEIITEKKSERHPLDDRLRRDVWWQIYVPIILFIIALAILAISLWTAQIGTTSLWGDISLILLIIPTFILGLILLLVLGGLAYGVTYLIGVLPGPFRQLHEILEQVFVYSQKVSEFIVKPIIVPRATGAAIRAVFRGITSIFRK